MAKKTVGWPYHLSLMRAAAAATGRRFKCSCLDEREKDRDFAFGIYQYGARLDRLKRSSYDSPRSASKIKPHASACGCVNRLRCRFVAKVQCKSFVHRYNRFAAARGIIDHLITLDLSYPKIFGVRMREIKAADACRRMHSERFR